MVGSKTIWKFPLVVTDFQTVPMPRGAVIISVGNQGDDQCISLWAIVDPDEPPQDREFEIFGTGNPMSGMFANRKFIGTVQMSPFVWHVFERHGR
jgi:hypothetical protein